MTRRSLMIDSTVAVSMVSVGVGWVGDGGGAPGCGEEWIAKMSGGQVRPMSVGDRRVSSD